MVFDDALDHVAGQLGGGRIDRAEFRFFDAVGGGVDGAPFGVGHLGHVAEELHLALDTDDHAGVDLAAEIAAVEEDECELVGAIVEGGFEAGLGAGADVIDGDDFAARGLDLIGDQIGDGFLFRLVLVGAREILEEVGEGGDADVVEVFGAGGADAS